MSDKEDQAARNSIMELFGEAGVRIYDIIIDTRTSIEKLHAASLGNLSKAKSERSIENRSHMFEYIQNEAGRLADQVEAYISEVRSLEKECMKQANKKRADAMGKIIFESSLSTLTKALESLRDGSSLAGAMLNAVGNTHGFEGRIPCQGDADFAKSIINNVQRGKFKKWTVEMLKP